MMKALQLTPLSSRYIFPPPSARQLLGRCLTYDKVARNILRDFVTRLREELHQFTPSDVT